MEERKEMSSGKAIVISAVGTILGIATLVGLSKLCNKYAPEFLNCKPSACEGEEDSGE